MKRVYINIFESPSISSKMKKILIVITILSAIILISVTSIYSKLERKQNIKPPELSTLTSAVCEEKDDFVYCKDEVFVNCNGNISIAVTNVECNGIKIDAPKQTGFAVFEKGFSRDKRE